MFNCGNKLELIKKVNAEKEIYRKLLRLWGYHGIYISLRSHKAPDYIWLSATFWRGEHKISLSIDCRKNEINYDEVKEYLLQIIKIAEYEGWQKVVNSDNILDLLEGYLKAIHLDDVQQKGLITHLSAHKNGVDYSVRMWMATKENDDIIEDEDEEKEALEFHQKEFEKELQNRGLSNFEVELSENWRSVKVEIEEKKIVEIRTFYDTNFNFWEIDAERIVDCYWKTLKKRGRIVDFINFLQDEDFYEIAISQENNNFTLTAYREGDKFQIKATMLTDADRIDSMEGHEFECFCADILAKNGFDRVYVTQGSGDQGVDVIAHKDGVKYGIQCKCYSSDVGNKAVQEVYAGKSFYDCHVGVVLTNRHFTKAAIELAKKNGIVLWDREKLQEFIKKVND